LTRGGSRSTEQSEPPRRERFHDFFERVEEQQDEQTNISDATERGLVLLDEFLR